MRTIAATQSISMLKSSGHARFAIAVTCPGCGPRIAAMHDYLNPMKRRQFPWFPAAMLALEANRVVALRLMKLASGGRRARAEASWMAAEKMGEAMVAGATLMAGGSAAKVIARYRRRVRSNARRLSAKRR